MGKRETMLKRYIGDRYLFEVESAPVARGFVFTITAIDRESGRRSHVNNVNGILSQFDLEEDDPRYEESDWWVSTKENEQFRARAGEVFRSQYQLRQIEATLDEDRMLGEWANTREEWNPANWIRLCAGVVAQ
jgi:hypothetical protein